MDEIQKVLVKAGRKDLANKYLEKIGAGIEEGDKASFDYIDTVVSLNTMPVGDSSFKVVLKTITKKDAEYQCSYPEEVNLGKMKDYRLKVKKEIFDSLLAIANKFDTDFLKIMKEYNLIKLK